jgi:hypothetical protein
VREVVAMADEPQIQTGADPWKPSDDSELVETYGYYDQPTLGLIRQHGLTYVFRCLDDMGDQASIWVYALLTDSEVEQLNETEDLPARLMELTAGKPLTVAFALESGIFEWLFLDELEGAPSILDSPIIRRALIPLLREQVHRLTNVTEHMEEELIR